MPNESSIVNVSMSKDAAGMAAETLANRIIDFNDVIGSIEEHGSLRKARSFYEENADYDDSSVSLLFSCESLEQLIRIRNLLLEAKNNLEGASL